jgi:hypothetical protein
MALSQRRTPAVVAPDVAGFVKSLGTASTLQSVGATALPCNRYDRSFGAILERQRE